MNRFSELDGGGGGGDDNGFSPAAFKSDSTYSAAEGGGGDTFAVDMGAPPPNSATTNFFERVSAVQAGIREIENETQMVVAKSGEHLECTDPEQQKALAEEIDRVMASINALSKEIKNVLTLMADETNQLKEKDTDQSRSAEIKLQENQHSYLVKSFFSAMKSYQQVQNENEKAYKDQVKRRMKTKHTNADGTTITDEEAEEMASQAIYSGQVDQMFQQSKDVLAQVLETRTDILRIEKSMSELHQIFNDLSVLVNEQGELLDNIAVNVANSVKYVEKGREELQKGKKYAKKGRKKMCYVIFCVFIIFILVLAPILGFTLGK